MPGLLQRRLIIYPKQNRRRNLLIRSEEFDNAVWAKEVNAAITANDAADPFGETTADLYTCSGNTRAVSQTYSVGDPERRTFCYSIFVKLETLTRFQLSVRRASDLSDATTDGNVTPGHAIDAVLIKIEDFGGGWYRYTFRKTFSTSTAGDDIQVRFSSSFIDASADTGTMHVFGAQLEENTTSTPYRRTINVPT